MSKPPEDEDTFFQILEQIKEALSQSDVVEPEDKEMMEELEKGIRNSLQALMGVGLKNEPNITIVEGGKAEDEEEYSGKTNANEECPASHEKPKLILLPPTEETEQTAKEEAESFLLGGTDSNWEISNVQVHVVSGDSLFHRLGKLKKKSGEKLGSKKEEPLRGLIALRAGDSQVILQSEQKHLYRVICLKGKLSLQSHLEELFIQEGQSVDIETNQLVALGAEASTGQYYKI